jgi:hypothetical protein
VELFSADRLHVIGSHSGAGWLIKTASDSGHKIRNRNLIGFHPEFYSVGPIVGVAAPHEHMSWLRENAPGSIRFAGLDGAEADFARAEQGKWDFVKRWSGPMTLWYSSRSIDELCFYLAFVWAVPASADTEFIDVARAPFDSGPVVGTGNCTSEMITEAAASARRLSNDELEADRRRFQWLNDEFRGVRVFEGDEIVEALIDVHDSRIIGKLSTQWSSTRRIVAELYNDELSRGVREIEYAFLLWRMKVLCEQGRIARRGESDKLLFADDPLKGDIRRIE